MKPSQLGQCPRLGASVFVRQTERISEVFYFLAVPRMASLAAFRKRNFKTFFFGMVIS